MSYQINKTNGALLVDLADGQIDNSTTDITLIGRNYKGFGEFINENFVKVLENFANTLPPSNPVTGQLWWDTSTNRLKIYTGTEFTSGGGPIVSAAQPTMVEGDLWINNESKQMYFYDGNQTILLGPDYSTFQGITGSQVETVLDNQSSSRTIIKFYIGNTVVAIYSKIAFTPAPGTQLGGLQGDVQKGINVIEQDFKWHGTATRADALIDATGATRLAAQFLPADTNGTTSGALIVQNSQGITVGTSQNNKSYVLGTSFVTENQLTDHDWRVRVRTTDGPVDAFYIKTDDKHVGLFTSTPQYTLDVNGDARIQGDLTITGSRIGIETEILRVKDKNIELGITDDSTVIDDATADGGGIILQSQSGGKEFVWNQTTNAWTSNVNINLAGTALKSNGITLIQGTAAPGITSLGALQSVDIDNVNIDGNTITSNNSGLQITSAGSINVTNNQKISGVADPTDDQDVATKAYVDSAINLETLSLALDITGLTNAQIAQVINDIAPASSKENGTEARVHCTDTTSATATFTGADLIASLQKTEVAVQALDGNGADSGSVSVLDDVTFIDVTGNVALTVDRSLKLFRVVGGAWAYIQELTSSV
jgi:hypothetical protein